MPKPDWYDEGKKNRELALERIRDFDGKYTQGFLQARTDYRNLGDDSKELREFVKALRLLNEDKDEVWKTLNKTCDALFAAKKSAQFDRKVKSSQSKEILYHILDDASGYASGSETAHFIKASNLLAEARDKMKDREKYPLVKEHSDEVWAKYKEAQEKLHYRRQSVDDSNYSAAKSAAYSAVHQAKTCAKLRDGSAALKQAGELLKNPMSRDQRSEVRTILDGGWDALKQKKEDNDRDWERRKTENEQKHREWLARQLDGIDRLEGALRKQRDFESHMENRIDDLRDKESDARSSEFANVVAGWRSEAEDKLSDVRRSIRELEDKIRDARSRLN
jgi:hypothetical protein